MTSLLVEIRGSDLPGRRCGPGPDGGWLQDVHVGLAYRADTIGFVAGDAPLARWELQVTVRAGEDGAYDFGGPFVHGRRGERALGLRWGTLASDDTFVVFRATKLRLSDVDPSLVERALSSGGRLVCSLGLTDQQGHPRCATVRPADLTWSTTSL